MKAMLVAACVAGPAVAAGAGDARTNWFNDPFFALTHELASCPEPLGPLVTEEEALRQSHHRAERGTRCHLEGRCARPSSFDYDAGIAEHIRADAAHIAPRPSTLWVLVQGRRVWVYGCVDATYKRGGIERAVRRIPDVEVALEEVRVGAKGAVPYRTR